jgi:site-specific recombinase XerD
MRKGQKYPAQPLTRAEIEALLGACNQGPTGARNRALIALLWRTGVRISEALALKPGDLDERSVRILHGKGDVCRTVGGLDVTAKPYLNIWLAERKALGFNARNPLFCTLKGEGLQTAYVRAMLKRLAEECGIEKRVHPHAFRHTMAFEWVNERAPLNIISAQLGHRSLGITEKYVSHLNPAAVIDWAAARA